MKNYPYNTGRAVTINLDNLGNADIWQLFTIVTAGTNNVFEGDEPDASPRADSDAAMEIFCHIAETADDRADGADAGQRAFFLGTKEEYLDIFEDGDGPANLPAEDYGNEEEPAAGDDSDEEPTEEEPEKIILDAGEYNGARLNSIIDCRGYDASAINVYDPHTREETIWVAGKDRAAVIAAYAENRTTEDFFIEAEVAAWKGNPANEDLGAALEANARDTNNDPNNLYRAGVFAGLAEAAAWMIYGRGICPDDINAITAAVYKAYGVAW